MQFLVLGAGAQGRAVAFDLARTAGTSRVVLADRSVDALDQAHRFLRGVLDRGQIQRLQTQAVDVADLQQVAALADGVDCVVSCVPYFLNFELAEMALIERSHFVDLGGNTDIVRRELELDERARAAGVSIVPDCGLGPGMISTAAVHAMNAAGYDSIDEVKIYDGGLPERRDLPFGYRLVFSVEGLINEYAQPATAIRDGRRVNVPALSEVEELDLPIGPCEAAHAAGGLSTMAWTYEGRVRTLYNKLIRYPGHIQAMRSLCDLGFFSSEPIDLDGVAVEPRHLAAKLLSSAFDHPEERDLVFIRVVVTGTVDGRRIETTGELLDRFDTATGMTAMMRTTGFPAAIVATMQARGEISPGARPVELAVPPELFFVEAEVRGLRFEWTQRELQ
jgi:lysine 6-dehydrogenase